MALTKVYTRQTTDATYADNLNAALTNAQIDANFINLNTNKLDIGWAGSSNIATVGTITSGTWNAGQVTSSSTVQGTQLKSTIATGTAPLTVTSTTVVTNLNADKLDGQDGSWYLDGANFTGTINSAVLGNSTVYIGSTAVALNRATGNLALTGITSIDGNAATATKTAATAAADSVADLVTGTMGANDFFRIRVGGASDAGWTELATADNGNEPIYVRQYSDAFTTIARTLTLLDNSGNTSVPGTLTVSGNLVVNGTTQTVNSTVVTIDDPVMTLGGDTATVETTKDRGIEMKYGGVSMSPYQVQGDGSSLVTLLLTAFGTQFATRGDYVTVSGASGTELNKLNGTWKVVAVSAGSNPSAITIDIGQAFSGSYTTSLGTYTKSKNAFFGLDQSSGKFIFLPRANNENETFIAGLDGSNNPTAKGTIDAYLEWSDILNKPYFDGNSSVANSVDIQLLAQPAGGGTPATYDSFNIQGSGIATVSWDDTNQRLTITATEADTLTSVLTRGSSTATVPTFSGGINTSTVIFNGSNGSITSANGSSYTTLISTGARQDGFNPGTITIVPGLSANWGNANSTYIYGGPAQGGESSVTGGKLVIQGGFGQSTAGGVSTGGDVVISGGTGTGSITNGGSVYIDGGSGGSGGGTTGKVYIGTASTTNSITLGLNSNTPITLKGLIDINSAVPMLRFTDTDVSGSYWEFLNASGSFNLRFAGNDRFNFSSVGSFTATGNVTANGQVYALSDSKVKKDVSTIENALSIVEQLRGVNYTKIDSNRKEVGVIAQEIQAVLPQVVMEEENGNLSVAYGNIVGVLIEAIKELKQEIDALKGI